MASAFRHRRLVGIRYPVWSSYGPQVLAGIVDFMREHEIWRLATGNDSFGEMEAVRLDGSWQGDGLILFRATEEELIRFRERGQAVVLTSTEGPDLGYPRVVPDNAMIGRLAAGHLLECAVPRAAFLGRGETFYREREFAPGLRRYARERLAGFRRELAAYALEPQVHYLQGRPLWKTQTWREIQEEVMEFLASLALPCGLFVVDDALGAVAVRAADALRLRVPEDLAVIAFGDDPAYCYTACPALSSIPYPGREIGRAAAEQLWRLMNGETSGPGRVEVPIREVVARDSSDTLAIADPEIHALVRHIRVAAPLDAIRVSELAERCPLSITTIKARFAEALGHGPKQEIQRVRLRHLKHLLAHTSWSLVKIAETMRFGSAHEMSRFFLAETGQRPSGFREERRRAAASTASACRQAVIFDLDGTLVDTEELYCRAYQAALAEQGGSLTRADYFATLAGLSNAAIERQMAAGASPGFDLETFRKGWRRQWQQLLAEQPLPPREGVRECLEFLYEAGIPVALASSSDLADIDACLRSSGLAAYFPVRAGGDEVEEGKPDPAVYLLACRRLGVSPSECLAVEDSGHGQRAALAAGMQVLRVSDTPPLPLPEGVRHVPSLVRFTSEDWREWLGCETCADDV